MNKPTQIILLALSILSIFTLTGEVLAHERNNKSSCRMFSTSGAFHSYEQRGRCVVKTYLDGEYIMVEIKTPWDSISSSDSARTDIMRLRNNSSCTTWQSSSDECHGEYWYDDEWSYLVAGEDVENGRLKFGYSLGNAYIVKYDGPLPRP